MYKIMEGSGRARPTWSKLNYSCYGVSFKNFMDAGLDKRWLVKHCKHYENIFQEVFIEHT